MELSSLTLTVTERCNLRCSYCMVPFDEGRTMSDEVIDAAVDLFDRHAAQSEATLSFYGGEPMLSLDRCKRALDGTRRAFDGKRCLRVLTPTNCTALDDETITWCRDEKIELALSVDGDAGETERRFADGRPVAPELMRRLPAVLDALPARRLLARMTVTPHNVGRLASNVRRLARLGFSRIVYLVAFEQDWDDEAIALWGREHRRIGTWLVGAAGAGRKVPDLPGWRAIEERLLAGRRRGWCGAGVRIAAVSTEGGLYPCYRLVFRGDDPASRLGDVRAGFTNHAALERYAAFDPNDVVPEEGSCASCEARDGCTCSCPALGLEMLGDIRRVPAVACRLMREQVAAIRPYAALERRPARHSTAHRIAAAVMAVAVTTAGAATATSCGGSTDGGKALDAGGDGNAGDVIGPGVCVQWDSGSGGYGGGGVCPAGGYGGGGICAEGGVAGVAGVGGGGICDLGGAAGVGGGGGLCPAGGGGIGGGGGICDPYDGGGGVCPYQVDSGMGGSGGYGGYGGGGGICKEYEMDPGAGASGGNGGGGVC